MARRRRQPRMVKKILTGHDFKSGGPKKNENTIETIQQPLVVLCMLVVI
jgi:hypothetical protein